MTNRENGEQRGVGGAKNADFAGVALARPGPETAPVAEIAEAEGMDVTQVRRVMRLTLLAPEVVERLVGSPDAVLEKVMRRPWPNAWGDQMRVLAPPG